MEAGHREVLECSCPVIVAISLAYVSVFLRLIRSSVSPTEGRAGTQMVDIIVVWPGPDFLCRAHNAAISLVESWRDEENEYNINQIANSQQEVMHSVKLIPPWATASLERTSIQKTILINLLAIIPMWARSYTYNGQAFSRLFWDAVLHLGRYQHSILLPSIDIHHWRAGMVMAGQY